MNERCWRIRMKAADRDYTRDAWRRGEVGIWYGAWSAEDFYAATASGKTQEFLAALPAQKDLGWKPPLPKSYFDTASRFAAIAPTDWVVLYLDETLHFARLEGQMLSQREHPLNLGTGEVFKYRRVTEHKSFRIRYLPDAYRLLAAAGRANVHEFQRTRQLVTVLSQAHDEAHAMQVLRELSAEEWLNLLGPSSWESLCLGYLILAEGFVPTGLMVGSTLPVFDIIGRASNGLRVLGQCKKDPYPVAVDEKFERACTEWRETAKVYYFAYGGCSSTLAGLRVVTRDDMLRWLKEEEAGQRYLEMLRGA